MTARGLRALRHSFLSTDPFVFPRVCRSTLRLRTAPYVTVSDPPSQYGVANISLAHPKDPSKPSVHAHLQQMVVETHAASNQPQTDTSRGSSVTNCPPPNSASPLNLSPTIDAVSVDNTSFNEENERTSGSQTSVPAKYVHPTIDPQLHLSLPHAPLPNSRPPFNTHRFLAALEQSLPPPVALNLMRATRGLLVNRISRVKRDALTTQDLESQAYLFRAALSELRTETSMLTRNETAAMRAATTALRREVDALATRMKEDITTLKHEIQMDVDSRKNEAKGDLKRTDMQIEEVLSRALITISELKTQVEESRWEKMKAAVGALAVLSLVIMLSMEIYVVRPQAKKRSGASPPPPQPEILPPSGGPQPWVT